MLTRRSLFREGALALGGAVALPGTILLPDSLPQAPQTETSGELPLRIIVVESLTESQHVMERLKKGEDFALLAMEMSIDPTSSNGGFLGRLELKTLRPELRDAVKGVEPGQFSGVTKIPEGYAILMVDVGNAPGVMGGNPTALRH